MISGVEYSGMSRSMTALWSERSRPDPSEMAQELFASTDADGSGAIDIGELTTALETKSGDGQGPDAQELFDLLDADGDGLITGQEHADGLASMHRDLAQASMMTSMSLSQSTLADELFESTDADGDGYITEEELFEAISARNQEEGGEVDAAELFSALDADGDGLITADEHAAGLESMGNGQKGMDGGHMPPPPAGRSQEVFDAADTNQDGVVDATELAASVAEANEASGGNADAEEILASLDADGDGVLSASEFIQEDGTEGTGEVAGRGLGQYLSASRFAMYQMMEADSWSSPASGFLSLRA